VCKSSVVLCNLVQDELEQFFSKNVKSEKVGIVILKERVRMNLNVQSIYFDKHYISHFKENVSYNLGWIQKWGWVIMHKQKLMHHA